MKRYLYLLCALFVAASANAQWLRVWSGGESTRYAVGDAASIPYSAAGSQLTIGGTSYSTAAIDSITIVNPVTITWTPDGVTVDIPESVEGITATVTDGDVVITNVNETTEQEFVLQGYPGRNVVYNTGSFTYNGTYKCKFHLNGLSLLSENGAAIDIECGKRVDLIIEDGTENRLADAYSGSQKAALYCKGHLEVSGGGSLSIKGNSKHGLSSKEYLLLKKSVGTWNISAASDGIHVGEYFMMNGGELTLSDIGGDGIQVETDSKSTEELNGQFVMNGGSIDLTVSAEDTKGIRLDDDATETTAATVVPEMHINDGSITVSLTAAALGSKAIASDGNMTIGTSTTSPTVDVTVAAGTYTDPTTEEENRATGLKADQTLTIAGGATTVRATGTKSRGVRATTLTATGGTLTVTNTGSKSQGIKLDNTFVSGQGGTVTGSFKYP